MTSERHIPRSPPGAKLAILAVVATGPSLSCNGLGLAQSFQIDRLRVLAIAADPAEPEPGDTVTFTSLVVDPVATVGITTWLACNVDSGYGCSVDPTLINSLGDAANMTPDQLAALYAELQAAGLIGVQPFFEPTWTVPADYLDGLTDDQKIEGSEAIVTVTAIQDVPGDTGTLDTASGDIEIAYKRVPVSLATTPNHNPQVLGLTVDGVAVTPGAVLKLSRGQTYAISCDLSAASIEDYTFVDDAGLAETRTEQPYFTWYLQEGSFDQSNTLWPYTTVQYTAPDSPTMNEQSLWCVVRDRRGGMAWVEQKLELGA